MNIDCIEAWEVLDSRVEPTVRVRVDANGTVGQFTVPAGASTGQFEAVEKRDGGIRYSGRGVQDAIRNIDEVIAPEIQGMDVTAQARIDQTLLDLDGTENLSKLGANAVLGVSAAVAHTAANTTGEPLHQYLSDNETVSLPILWCQLISGGLHARGGLEIQDISVIPMKAPSFSESVEYSTRLYHMARERVIERGSMPLVGDEGGFGMKFDSVDRAFEFTVEVIEHTGFSPGRESVALALDVAASHFYREGQYKLDSMGQTFTSDQFVDEIVRWIDTYPIISLEDPLAEDDWDGWNQLTDRVGDQVQLVGDDLLVTNEIRLDRAIGEQSANAILVKPNQTGTVSSTRSVVSKAQRNGLNPVISARSGETADTTIADMAVAWDTGQLKLGSFRGTERSAKINRLLYFEREYGYEFQRGIDRFRPFLEEKS